MSTSMTEANLEKKFQGATNTQDSIQTLSLWLVHHKAHYEKVVAAWMKVLQKAKINHRLTLFYLANDVIQNSKRKGFLHYVNAFSEILKEATLLVRDENIRQSITRVFRIWEERSVFSPDFITELRAILVNSKVPSSAPKKLLSAFKPEVVVEKLRMIQKLEMNTAKTLSSVNQNKLNATNAEIIQQLKDRIHGQQFKREFDENARSLEELIKKMTDELSGRNELVILLEQSEIYYDTQKGEAKVVANAYKNFGTRVKNLQKKLEEVSSSLPSPSPVPSPTVDAPSPVSDHDVELELPHDNEDIENLSNAPSPVGSPDGLDLPPDESKSPASIGLGNPIPTLSNFFSHDHNGMSSWLDTFQKKKERAPASEKPPPANNLSSSLDSRLSNLLQNIPNLPSSLQNSLFSSSPTVTASPVREARDSSSRKDKISDSLLVLTPNKDECSGQNTPLQDEDTLSSQSFFNKLSSANKAQSPKDILKGLTNLIQSASVEKEDNQKKYFSSSDIYKPQDSMSTFMKSSIVPPSHLTSTYFVNTPPTQPPVQTFIPPVQTLPPPIQSFPPLTQTLPTILSQPTTTSYYADQFTSTPSYATLPPPPQSNHMSFIPSIVPSMSHDTYGYSAQPYPSDEYNPEAELYNTDMDLDDDDIPSPAAESPSPIHDDDIDEPPRSIGGRRLSTLITVITKDSPVEVEHNNNCSIQIQVDSSTKESNNIDLINPNVTDNNTIKTEVNSERSEDFHIDDTDIRDRSFSSAPPQALNPINGQMRIDAEPANMPRNSLMRIETVQLHDEHLNGRWHDNQSDNFQRPSNNFRGRFNGRHMRGPMPNMRFPNPHRNPHPPFPPRGNWGPRFRPDRPMYLKRNHPYPPRPFGPPPHQRFPFRGNWGRGRPQF